MPAVEVASSSSVPLYLEFDVLTGAIQPQQLSIAVIPFVELITGSHPIACSHLMLSDNVKVTGAKL